jgi:Putative Actinobacterial Holin-X, holin superfamily III
VNPGVYPREPTVAQLLTGLMQDAQTLLRQEVALATHELQRELRTTIRAVMSLGIGIGLAAIGGWLLILMLVHLLHALTALPLWACDGIVGGLLAAGGIGLLVLGKQTLVQLHLVPQDTVKTMKENVQWLTEQVRPNSRVTRDRQR